MRYILTSWLNLHNFTKNKQLTKNRFLHSYLHLNICLKFCTNLKNPVNYANKNLKILSEEKFQCNPIFFEIYLVWKGRVWMFQLYLQHITNISLNCSDKSRTSESFEIASPPPQIQSNFGKISICLQTSQINKTIFTLGHIKLKFKVFFYQMSL